VRGQFKGPVALAVLLLALVAPVPGAAQSTDPRAALIKGRVESQGLKVTSVDFAPAKGTAPAVWAVGTVATYQDPSWIRITDQALTVWGVMFAVLRQEAPATLLATSQDWKTYRLLVATTLGDLTAFDASARTARTDADKQKATETLHKTIRFRVFDLQTQKAVDVNEFARLHFK
jgi:hypothetical protein